MMFSRMRRMSPFLKTIIIAYYCWKKRYPNPEDEFQPLLLPKKTAKQFLKF